MTLMLVLDPTRTRQALWIETLDPGDRRLEARVELYSDGVLVVSASADSLADTFHECSSRYGVIATTGSHACIPLDFRPVPGAQYQVVVYASDRPTATASVLIPGEFELLDVAAGGSPPGTEGLEATWSRSAEAHAYIVALRAEGNDCADDVRGCPGGWYMVTSDTLVDRRVSSSELHHGRGSWYLDIYAVDRALYEYLTSGAGGNFFSIPPVSNVAGGRGVVGAWRRVSYGLGS